MEVLEKYDRLWASFTPNMKATFRRLIRKDGMRASNIPAATRGAFRRKGIIMESAIIHRAKKTYHIKVYLNWRGCELLDYLRITRQMTKDRERTS